MNPRDLVALIRCKAEEFKVDADLAEAIATVESSLNPFVTRFEPNYRYFCHPELYAARLRQSSITETVQQQHSYGAMQIMGGVCREYGYQDYLMKLVTNHEECISLSMRHLSKFDKQYENEMSVIAAYNAGSARKVQLGVGAGVKFTNQAYVDKVSLELRRLRNL